MIRHFNTSRELKQPKDTSTMDFAYFPDLDPDNVDANLLAMRVPIIPDNYYPPRTGAHAPEVEEMVSLRYYYSQLVSPLHWGYKDQPLFPILSFWIFFFLNPPPFPSPHPPKGGRPT